MLALIFAVAFVLGWMFWPNELLVAAAGVVLTTATWWNPRGLGTAITWLAAKIRLPGVRSRASGAGAAFLLAVDLVLVPAGAGALGQYAYAQVANAPVQLQLGGHVAVAGPLTGATVEVVEMRSDGKAGALLGTATTDQDGYWTTYVEPHRLASLLLTTSGGSYVDEVSKKTIQAGANDALRTILAMSTVPVDAQSSFSQGQGQAYAELNPLTTFATARAVVLGGSGQNLDDSIVVSFSAVARQYDLTSITATYPTIANSVTDVNITSRESRDEGLILAGLDTEAIELGVSNFALSDALASDLSDGEFDGMNGNTPIFMEDSVPLPPGAGGAGLQGAIQKFAGSPGNATHLGAPQIALQSPHIDLVSGGLWVNSAALPAWVDGVAAAVQIEGSGGTPPYSCALLSGGMPQGFAFQSDCTITYDGTLILGPSSMRIVGPFSVQMQDSPGSPGQAPNTVTFELPGITIVAPPPKITARGGDCPGVKKSCSVVVATATGGSPPYFFSYGSLWGTPLGMFISSQKANGVITGKPATAGLYTFDVCVTDLAGAQACTTTTVMVGPTSSSERQSTRQPAPAQTPSAPACIFSIAYPAYVGGGTLVMSLGVSADVCDSTIAQDSAAFTAAGYAMTRPGNPPRTKPVCSSPDFTIWGTGAAGLSAAQALCANGP